MLLVCACSLKPPVQENCRPPLPVWEKLSMGGPTTRSETTPMLPSTARLLVQVALAPVMVSADPFSIGRLNRVNLSPTARAGPRFVTPRVPAPVLVSTPLTTTRSLDGERDLFTSMS